jgi:hypothetical protein
MGHVFHYESLHGLAFSSGCGLQISAEALWEIKYGFDRHEASFYRAFCPNVANNTKRNPLHRITLNLFFTSRDQFNIAKGKRGFLPMKLKPRLKGVKPTKKEPALEAHAEKKAKRLEKSPLHMPMQEAMRKFRGMT